MGWSAGQQSGFSGISMTQLSRGASTTTESQNLVKMLLRVHIQLLHTLRLAKVSKQSTSLTILISIIVALFAFFLLDPLHWHIQPLCSLSPPQSTDQ
jgi:hypothetical protein